MSFVKIAEDGYVNSDCIAAIGINKVDDVYVIEFMMTDKSRYVMIDKFESRLQAYKWIEKNLNEGIYVSNV